MERKQGIEDQIDSVLASARKINSVDAPSGFTERAMQRLNALNGIEFSIWPALLKIAAVVVLVVVNSYTAVYIINGPSQEQQEVIAPESDNINDLVTEYQASDFNEDILTPNNIEHEQP
ncbi:MAG TPA: hypothetical protein VK806_09520 [Bacteroidia bacterium]|jgi:hypothetical protein|nr:hypothetical protein [Bacteroidia bacterium]